MEHTTIISVASTVTEVLCMSCYNAPDITRWIDGTHISMLRRTMIIQWTIFLRPILFRSHSTGTKRNGQNQLRLLPIERKRNERRVKSTANNVQSRIKFIWLITGCLCCWTFHFSLIFARHIGGLLRCFKSSNCVLHRTRRMGIGRCLFWMIFITLRIANVDYNIFNNDHLLGIYALFLSQLTQ